MEKRIIELNQDDKGHTYTLVEVIVATTEEHKQAREELKKIKTPAGGHQNYYFFLVKADEDSFRAKCWGNAVEQLEKIGYSF